jgi:hypothetical protein
VSIMAEIIMLREGGDGSVMSKGIENTSLQN